MRNDVIVFIFEGEKRESELVAHMTSHFFNGKNESIFINLPVKQNCYMLWQQLKADDFNTDIIELLRESIPEAADKLNGISRQQIDQIFMFFDYDPHQNNLPAAVNPKEVIAEMLEVFNNETENGKLYISYPMIEALRDFSNIHCESFYACCVNKDDIPNYKTNSGNNNPYAQLKKYTIETWENILHIFCWKIACLFELNSLTYETYRNEITPNSIYDIENKLYDNGKCFVLSAIPEFMFDYFQIGFWKKFSALRNKHRKSCGLVVH